MSRNVSIYSTCNSAGTYYFGSDTASPVDANYPYSNLLTGSFFAYGEDSKKMVNQARYTQVDWFALGVELLGFTQTAVPFVYFQF
jgi:hypothetical protein